MIPFSTVQPSQMDHDAFVAAFADVYEHSPWVAETVYQAGVDETLDAVEVMHVRMSQAMLSASREAQLALIRAHPDLAGRAAIAGELSAASTSEQAAAGIQACTPEEYARFGELNEAYKARFGFPFIMAVKGCDRQQILTAFEQCLHNTPEQEFARALAEINRIALFRLQAM